MVPVAKWLVVAQASAHLLRGLSRDAGSRYGIGQTTVFHWHLRTLSPPTGETRETARSLPTDNGNRAGRRVISTSPAGA